MQGLRVDHELPRKIARLIRHLSDYGYTVDGTEALKLATLCEAVGCAELSAELICPVVAKTPEEWAVFPEVFEQFLIQTDYKRSASYAELESELDSEQTRHAKRLRQLLEQKRKLTERSQSADPAVRFGVDLRSFERAKKAAQPALDMLPEPESWALRHLDGILSGMERMPTPAEVEEAVVEAKKRLMAGLIKGVPCYKQLSTFLAKQTKVLQSLLKEQQSNHLKLDKLEAKITETEAAMEAQQKQFEAKVKKLLRKQGSITHRPEFIASPYNRAVQSWSDAEADTLDKPLTMMTNAERTAVFHYIKENANQFRMRLAQHVNTGQRRKLDLARTCKLACGTNGVPIRLAYEHVKRKKTKLLMFLDISGSCKEASELMLVFMRQMQDVFPGGCKTYAFVNSLYDISTYTNNASDATVTEAVLSAIPTRGVYSDYYTPFRQFVDQHWAEVTTDTIVFYMGDARNNKNLTGEEYVKAISRKCRKAYWLNTEKRMDWDTGDSIMGVYAQYMTQVFQVTSVWELLTCLGVENGRHKLR